MEHFKHIKRLWLGEVIIIGLLKCNLCDKLVHRFKYSRILLIQLTHNAFLNLPDALLQSIKCLKCHKINVDKGWVFH